MVKKTPQKTNAARCLDKLGLPYELVSYTPGPALSAAEAADFLGLPYAAVFKTILLRGEPEGLMEACIPADAELDLKALAAVSGNKRAALVPLKELTPLTGYLRGGCSPIGGLKNYPVYVDRGIVNCDKILINAGSRGLMLSVKPSDLLKATGGILAGLTRAGRIK
ncbi:MAG: aminoacyl-tRNA deacylase [Deltaproteobacteria bacterium]|jgi:Cys-tRNA(Pro)/Cys-tRNA(Cys) deacylase|nr:aminoacyl-tRNA deacylase [Deltaproteobacteria bacterium]